MFEARLAQASLLKHVVDAIKDIIPEASLVLSRAGITMQAMDSSHTSLCQLHLRPSGFEDFRCDRDQTVGLSLTHLAKVLKFAGNDDTITIRTSHISDVVMFVIESTKTDKICEFEFRIMDIDCEQLTVPDTKYDSTVKMPAREFRTIISDLAALGDNCTIHVTKENAQFSVTGDMGTAAVCIRQKTKQDDTKDGCVIHASQPVKLTYAMRLLQQFVKATPLSEHVMLSMSSDHPIVAQYTMEGAGNIKFYLAPKVDEPGA